MQPTRSSAGGPAPYPEVPAAQGPGGYLTLSGSSADVNQGSPYMPPQLSMEPSLQPRISASSLRDPEATVAAGEAAEQPHPSGVSSMDPHHQNAPMGVIFYQEPEQLELAHGKHKRQGSGSSKGSKSAVEMSNPAFWIPSGASSDLDHARKAALLPGGHSGSAGEPSSSNVTEEVREGEEEEEEEEEIVPLVSEKREPPIKHKWNWWPMVLLFWFVCGAAYHFYIRVVQLNGTYGIVIMALELVGLSSFIPYAILLTRGMYPTGSPGLPPAGVDEFGNPAKPARQASIKAVSAGRQTTVPSIPSVPQSMSQLGSYGQLTSPFFEPDAAAHVFLSFNGADAQPGAGLPSIKDVPAHQAISFADSGYGDARFHVRVLIPCYKEPLNVVSATLEAALEAALPANTRRTIYLCDDGKDAEKRAFVQSLGPDVVYVTGRKRKAGEINGKSANLNNCLKNYVYKDWPKNEKGEIDWTEISNKELVVVFDADMCAKPEFFLRLLEVMSDDELALTLSPQSFHNISSDADLFNNINKQFWECWLPGAFAWGYIACTGTNFMIRARALAHCGWFPDYTITEDYALGMELKSRGYKATYLMLYLAVGEAPDEIRNVFRQRSRWNKGHFQVFFSRHNPILYPGLPFFQRLWYSYAAWAPICTIITVPTFMVVPFMSIFFGFNPVTITFEFVLSATIYYVALALIQNYSYSSKDWRLMWFANASNTVLWFTYCKALFNSMLAKLGMKVMAFKVTEKVKPQGDAAALQTLQPQQSMLQRMATMATGMVPGRTLSRPQFQPLLSGNPSSANLCTASGSSNASVAIADTPPLTPFTATSLKPAETADTALLQAMPTQHTLGPAASMLAPQSTGLPAGSIVYVRGAQHMPGAEKGKKNGMERFKAVLRSFKPAHIKEFDEMFDPLVLLLLFCFSAATFGFGLWQTIISINQRAPASFDLGSPMKGSPYLIISTLWAFCNCIVPYLFLHYCITAGTTFKVAARALMILMHVVMAGSVVLIWFLIPTQFDMRVPLNMQMTQFYPNQVLTDTTANLVFVQGLDATPVNVTFDIGHIQSVASRLAAANAQYNSRRLLLSDDDAEFDPAAVTDAELNAPGRLAAWQRSLLQSADAAGAAAANLPAGLDLSGGLIVKDNVKYAMPMGYAITQLAWGLLQYPKGYSSSQTEAAKQVIRAGADYLIRCSLKTADGRPVFVAQMGDARDYMVIQDMVQDPAAAGKIWTSPQQDPYLTGQKVRKVWLLDENHVGADLLSNVAAALSAASMVLADNPTFSNLALDTAKAVYALATVGQPSKPHSYCEYIPCQANVTISKQQLMVPVSRVPVKAPPKEAQCYYIDWPTATCQMLYTIDECSALSRKQHEVFKGKAGCCAVLSSTGIWDGLVTKAQGICAVPDQQWYCYVPDSSQRMCYQEKIDRSGWGCAGRGLEVYATRLACCNYLVTEKFIDADAGKPGAGLCARANIDTNFTTCYVPSYANATCLKRTGADCVSFGARTMFSEPTACCNNLILDLMQLGINPQGICEFPKNATNLMRPAPAPTTTTTAPAPAPTPLSTLPTNGKRRSALASVANRQATSMGHGSSQRSSSRHMLQDAPSPSTTAAAAPPPLSIPEDLLWREPKVKTANDYVFACNSDEDCNVRPVLSNVTVAFYNSTTTLDDLAWGGVWLYWASMDGRYLGAGQRFLERHYQEDITAATLTSDRTYYRSNWDNVAWATNTLLLTLTKAPEYDVRVRTLLNSWLFGRNIKPPAGGVPTATSPVNVTLVNEPKKYNDTAANVTYYLVPTCIATANYEDNCFDGIDNDCDGVVDREDIDCGLFPVVYSPKNLAYSDNPSLPNAAAMSWISMVYADSVGETNARKLRCWALGQVAYMMGAAPDTRSYIAGYKNFPEVVGHMASSCPAPGDDGQAPVCNWDNGFWPTVKNPQMKLVGGALMAGPDRFDNFVDLRINPQTQVTLDGTAPLTGVLAGLLQTGTGLRSCELMHGLYQRLAGEQEL